MSEEKNQVTAKKPFFKSVAFKCIMVLLVIVLVSGIFLTLCNSLFYVSDEERLQRALGKLYDGDGDIAYTEESVDGSVSVDSASINAVYMITTEQYAGDYIINVTGEGGYQSGTVTCYVVVNITNSALSVGKVSISSNEGQSFISKVSSKALDSFEAVYGVETTSTGEYYVLYNSTEGFYTDEANNVTNHLATGATRSMGAICNAVNGAVTYMKAKYLGEVAADPYENFDYADYINKNSTTYSVSGEVVTYSIKTKQKGNSSAFTITITVDSTEKVVTFMTSNKPDDEFISYFYATDNYIGMGAEDIAALLDLTSNSVVSDSVLQTGASDSNFLCAYAALFATANYQNCIDAAGAEVN